MEITEQRTGRSDLLTVLCILSFIGIGWRLLRSSLDLVAGIFTRPVSGIMDEVINDLESEMNTATHFAREIIAAVQDLMNHLSLIAAIELVFILIALYGVITMWNLKKTGFYIYSSARIMILLVPVVVLGPNIFSLLMLASGTVFAALFIILYSLNLKDMV